MQAAIEKLHYEVVECLARGGRLVTRTVAEVRRSRRCEHGVESQGRGLGARDGAYPEELTAADDFAQRSRAEACQDLPRLLRHGSEEADDVFRRAAELRAEVVALRGDAGRAGVEMALPRHNASCCDERSGAEAEFLRSEKCGQDYVPSRLEAAVHLQAHALAQPRPGQRLVSLGQAELPRRAGVPDGAEWRRAGVSIVAVDLDGVGVGLGHADGDGADAAGGNELYAHGGAAVDLV